MFLFYQKNRNLTETFCKDVSFADIKSPIILKTEAISANYTSYKAVKISPSWKRK
jgi:hypothetical protein